MTPEASPEPALNTRMGTETPSALITNRQIDQLAEMWDNGDIRHSGKNTPLLLECLGLRFNPDAPPHPYGGINTHQWALNGTIVVPVMASFFLRHGQVPTPSHLLCKADSRPTIIYCLAPALVALAEISTAQEVEMYEDRYATSLTYLFRTKDEPR